MLQTMPEVSLIAASISLKTDTSYSEVMDASDLSEGRGDVSKTWLWTASSLSGTMLSFMDVHMNNTVKHHFFVVEIFSNSTRNLKFSYSNII